MYIDPCINVLHTCTNCIVAVKKMVTFTSGILYANGLQQLHEASNFVHYRVQRFKLYMVVQVLD